jgi:hypothetical protein
MSETLMMIDPILNTAPVCQGIRLAGLSIGRLQTDLFDPDLVLAQIDRHRKSSGGVVAQIDAE